LVGVRPTGDNAISLGRLQSYNVSQVVSVRLFPP